QIFTVSFDLNNEEALIATPDSQSIEDGQLAIKPNDPVVTGFKFNGWYTDKECTQAFDFNSPIEKRTALYANWTKTAVGTIDGSDLPAYEWEKDSAYGERPDLEGFVIDGKMGAEENWEEQKWYHTGITEAPTVSYDFTTIFSDKGLYFFVKAVDNGGLAFTGRGYYYKNTSFDISIIDGDLAVGDANKLKTISFDTYNAKPSILKFKLATRVIEGEVNPSDDYKTGVWTTECFITWKELGMSARPQSVKVFPQYNYKRLMSETKTLKLYPTFLSSTSMNGYKSFIPFNENGYVLADEQNTVLGDSPLGIAKTVGWDISHVNATENAYLGVDNSANGMQAIFFKDISGSYYSVQTNVEITPETVASGDIGLMIYDSSVLYVAYAIDMGMAKYNENGFTSISPKFIYTNSVGSAVSKFLNTISYTVPVKNITLRVIFSNGYVYFIVNGVLIDCQYEVDLNQRTNAAIIGQNAKNMRLSNYSSRIYTQEEAIKESSAFAHMISVGKSENVTLSFSSIGQSVENPQPITMEIRHRNVVITNQIAEMVLNGDYSRISMYEIDKITLKQAMGEEIDASAQMLGENGIKYGKYVFDTINTDTEISITSKKTDNAELTYVKANLIDSLSNTAITRVGEVTIYSNDSRISNYTMATVTDSIVVPVKKGYDYEIVISVPGYRPQTVSYKDNSALVNVTDVVDLGDLILTLNVVGGTATAPDNSFSVTSAVALWDYTNEENGEVYIEPLTASSTQAYFSGDVIAKHQVAEVKIANITDKVEHPSYEKDPAAGFCFVNKTGSSERRFIGLHKNGLRILYTRSGGWNPTDIYSNKLGSTVNSVDTTGNTYTTLTVVKIDKGDYADVYTYVNGIFIEKITFDGLGGYSAIGFDITTSYYLKLKFFDYWIKTDDEALEYAKTKLGNTVTLDESCYDFNDNYEYDMTKPMIKIENLEQFESSDGTVENVAMQGSEFKISLVDENTDEGSAYIVYVGTESFLLTKNNPSVYYNVKSSNNNIVIRTSIDTSVTVKGKVLAGGVGASEVIGELISSNGMVITFETNVDGTFEIEAISSMTYTVSFTKNMYAFEKVIKRIGGYDVDWGEFNLNPVVFGGEGSTNQAKWGYDYDDGTNKIEGLYTEVDAKADNTQIYTYKPINNAIIDFSFVRLDIPNVTDEQYPAIGVCIITEDGVREFYGVQYGGGVVLDGKDQWSAPIKASNVLSFTTKGFNFHFDVRVVKNGNVVSIFAKLPNDTEYTYVMTHTSRFNLSGATIGLRVTAGAPSHHFFYNEKVTEFTDDTLPTDIARTLNITSKEGGDYEVVNAKSQYVVGETVHIKVIPQSGKTAFIKVNGSEYFYADDNGIVSYTVRYDANDIEVYFEDKAEDITLTGKLVATNGVTLPSTFNFSVHFEDGRVYNFDGVEIASDGSFAFDFREGSYTVRGTNGSMVAKTVYVNLTKNASDIGTLEVYDIFLGGNSENYGSTSVPIYGYDFDDGTNKISGPYIEVNQRGNAYMAMRVGKMEDFEFSFSYIRKEAVGFTNEEYPAVGLIFNNGSTNEFYIFQQRRAIVLDKGWSAPIKSDSVLNQSMYTYDLSFDLKIVRKGNVITFYGKVSTETEYEKVFEYESKVDYTGIEGRFVSTAGATQLRFIVYNMSYKAL
ncbi:MAG: InlB B-repeat-containing protein, partial [Clostridia bacterium]|nr:InlB B-repeat-containing protein [Clostridia bacterium]